MDEMKFGVFFPFYALRNVTKKSSIFKKILDVIAECERLGYSSFWLDDHLMQGKKPILECWSTLSALSSVTKKIRLGTMVSCNSFRKPSLLAKIASSVDNISNGRLELGLGAGIQRNEHNAYGFSFPSLKIRIEQLDESIQIIKKMWTEEKVTYRGKYYSLKEAICYPKPIQKSYPPIIIGGSGELTLRVCAKHADRFDWGFFPSLELYKNKLIILERLCKQIGRDFNVIEKSCWPFGQILIEENKNDLDKRIRQWIRDGIIPKDYLNIDRIGIPEDYINKLHQYMNLGATYYMLFFGDLPNLSGIRIFSEKVIQKI